MEMLPARTPLVVNCDRWKRNLPELPNVSGAVANAQDGEISAARTTRREIFPGERVFIHEHAIGTFRGSGANVARCACESAERPLHKKMFCTGVRAGRAGAEGIYIRGDGRGAICRRELMVPGLMGESDCAGEPPTGNVRQNMNWCSIAGHIVPRVCRSRVLKSVELMKTTALDGCAGGIGSP